MLGGECDVLRLQLLQLVLEGHHLVGDDRQLDVAHQHHHCKADGRAHAQNGEDGHLLPLAHLRLGEAPHPGLRLGDGLYRRLVTGSLSGVPKSALPDFPV